MKRALLILLCSTAHASVVQQLGPAELYAGADRVVEATVTARWVVWNATHTGLETRATLDDGTELVVPGGELPDGSRHVIVGMPSVIVGERARWFLAARGDGTYRVYGWAQGKQSLGGFAADYTTNGMVWPSSPVPYLVNSAGTPDLPFAQVVPAIDAAFATWQAVPCSSLAYTDAGTTSLGMATDTSNVILFTTSGWQFGSEAAAATSLWIIPGMQTADIALNNQDWTWAIDPPSNAIDAKTLDLQSVLTHEIGHFSGLGHTQRAYDTMYYAWKPWQDQRHLSIDDKLGLCSIYPKQGDECPPACAAGEMCTSYANGTLCTGQPDPVGTPCNYDHVACDGFCLFTAVDLSAGYCSRFCTANQDCPLAYHCGAASSAHVCLAGAQPVVDPCSADGDCAAGQYCNGTSCTFDCRTSSDCNAGDACDATGRCVPARGGGCQATVGTDRSGPSPWPLLLTFLWPLRRRRGSRAASRGSSPRRAA